MGYDRNNVFAGILRGEIPCSVVAETAHSLAFRDISPLAPTHVLVIPRGEYTDMDDFLARASTAEIADLVRLAGDVAGRTGVAGEGWRLVVNCGVNARAEVPHLHLHVLGGRDLGPVLARDTGRDGRTNQEQQTGGQETDGH